MIPEQTHGLEMAYRRMDPTADCGIQVFGEDLKALFENAGLALFDLIADIRIVKSGVEHPIQVSGSDWPDLMVNWLRELLYFWTVKEQLVKEIAVTEIIEYLGNLQESALSRLTPRSIA